MDAHQLRNALVQMADAIAKDIRSREAFLLVGIHTRGVQLAERLKVILRERIHLNVPVGSLDITLYRDDWTRLHSYPVVQATTIPGAIDDKEVVLVDDVLYTGRTIRAALDALLDYGRPRRVYVAVLVDRGHRELPICAQYIGLEAETRYDEHVYVHLEECDGADEVISAISAAA